MYIHKYTYALQSVITDQICSRQQFTNNNTHINSTRTKVCLPVHAWMRVSEHALCAMELCCLRQLRSGLYSSWIVIQNHAWIPCGIPIRISAELYVAFWLEFQEPGWIRRVAAGIPNKNPDRFLLMCSSEFWSRFRQDLWPWLPSDVSRVPLDFLLGSIKMSGQTLAGNP
jgi:hypothetical protein